MHIIDDDDERLGLGTFSETAAKSWILNIVGGLGRSRKYFNGITIR